MDIILTVAGIAMGAAWGTGAVLSVAITGPIMQFVIQRTGEAAKKGADANHSKW